MRHCRNIENKKIILMDPEYEKHLNSCGIKKNHEVKITVREVSSECPQSGGELIWTHTGKGYGSMHAVIKEIYSAVSLIQKSQTD